MFSTDFKFSVTNVSQTWSTIERVKDGSRLFSRNVFCAEQKGRRPITSQ